MKIDNYKLNMLSNREYIYKKTETKKSLFWVGNKPSEKSNNDFAKDLMSSIKERMQDIKNILNDIKNISRDEDIDDLNIEDKSKIELKMLIEMVEKFTGKKLNSFKVIDSDELKNKLKDLEKNNSELKNDLILNRYQNINNREWGFEYNYDLERYEYEKLNFSSSGMVKTSDGREISFDLEMSMERAMFEKESFNFTVGSVQDPLVINYDTMISDLDQEKFEFDLNSDGIKESISYLKDGMGFLAFDKNENGKIDDGSELFGPESGNGFSELSAYDQDKNGWIDENDEIFNDLRVWAKTSNGTDMLFTLKETGVGAIYLGNSKNDYSLKTSIDNTLGVIRNTGIFLKETGEVGTIHNIDFSV